MSNPGSINEIKTRHEELYAKAVKDGKTLAENDGERQAFIRDVDCLLQDIIRYAEEVSTLDDYRWLSDAVTSWQVVLASSLNTPKVVNMLPPPPKGLLPPLPTVRVLTEVELGDWRKQLATILGLWRKAQLGRLSSQEEMDVDWYNAQVYLASNILDGFPNFAGRVGSNSYWRLEEVWLKSVKNLRAYFIWQATDNALDPARDKQHYYQACEQLRNMLVDTRIKGRLVEFGEPKAYVESRYLSNGKLDQEKPAVKMLIARDAKRIWETTGETNQDKNWLNAETYVRMFYESIIPAVLDQDREKTLTVLKAFQYSKTPENAFWVINCFEVALATYFLDPDIIQALWDESAQQPMPESAIESIVAVQAWPAGFDVPEEFRDCFHFDGHRVIFKGLMTESQREAILTKLVNDTHKDTVNALFRQSRLIHQNTTL